MAVLLVPEIRDYQRINAELARRLDAGRRRVRLAGVEGQRLLLAGLLGPWAAVVEVDGRPGPELAAGLRAPGLVVVCRGQAADGAGRDLQSGRLLLLEGAGDGLAAWQRGGSIVALGEVGHRAGLRQSGGTLVLLGSTGALAGDRQSGGRLIADPDGLGPHPGRGRTGGAFIPLSEALDPAADPDQSGRESLRDATKGLRLWLPDHRVEELRSDLDPDTS